MSTRGRSQALVAVTPAWEAFALAAADTLTPCRGSEAWTSEDATVRAAAAIGCRPCPLRRLCRDAADSTGETWGVWSGVDRAPKTKTTTTTGRASA